MKKKLVFALLALFLINIAFTLETAAASSHLEAWTQKSKFDQNGQEALAAIEKVKNSNLKISPATPVGTVLDRYTFFQQKAWRYAGKGMMGQAVDFIGVLFDCSAPPLIEVLAKEHPVNSAWKARLASSKDKVVVIGQFSESSTLPYLGLDILGPDGTMYFSSRPSFVYESEVNALFLQFQKQEPLPSKMIFTTLSRWLDKRK